MELAQTLTIPATVEATWRALNDPDFLKDCIAGCESIESTGEGQYKVVVAARIGPVSARFAGRLQLQDLQPPHAYTVVFEGQGGAAGFAKGSAQVTLKEQPGEPVTQLSYLAKAQVGGKLAQIGSRLVDSAASKQAADFFAAFSAKLLAQQSPEPASTRADHEPVEGGRSRSRTTVIVLAAAAVAALLLWLRR